MILFETHEAFAKRMRLKKLRDKQKALAIKIDRARSDRKKDNSKSYFRLKNSQLKNK